MGAAHLRVMTTHPRAPRRRPATARPEANICLVPDPPEDHDPWDDSTDSGQDPEPLLTPEGLSRMLVIPVKTLAHWRNERSGPLALKVGTRVRYRLADVNAWLDGLAADARLRWAD